MSDVINVLETLLLFLGNMLMSHRVKTKKKQDEKWFMGNSWFFGKWKTKVIGKKIEKKNLYEIVAKIGIKLCEDSALFRKITLIFTIPHRQISLMLTNNVLL